MSANRYKRWTDADDAVLLAFSIQEAAEILGRTVYAVKTRRCLKFLTTPQRRRGKPGKRRQRLRREFFQKDGSGPRVQPQARPEPFPKCRLSHCYRNAVCRLMQTNIPSVLRQLEWAGKHCAALLEDRLQGLKCRHLECDEIWTFCSKKQARLTVDEKAMRHDIGDVYLWTAQDQDSRLIAYHLLGKRSADNARRFMVRLADRLEQPDGGYGRPQISVDGFAAYPEAVDLGFGNDCSLGVLIKQFRDARMQYDPGEIIASIRRPMRGGITPWSICTSHVERNNLTIRTFMKRFTRLAMGFSRKLANLEHACNLHMAYFNFCWRPGKMKISPAQAAGIADRCWTFDELLA